MTTVSRGRGLTTRRCRPRPRLILAVLLGLLALGATACGHDTRSEPAGGISSAPGLPGSTFASTSTVQFDTTAPALKQVRTRIVSAVPGQVAAAEVAAVHEGTGTVAGVVGVVRLTHQVAAVDAHALAQGFMLAAGGNPSASAPKTMTVAGRTFLQYARGKSGVTLAYATHDDYLVFISTQLEPLPSVVLPLILSRLGS